VMDNQSRIAVVRVGVPFADDNTPAVKFHLGDHLGSSKVVIGSDGVWINREEYTPYGESSFGSFALKRYRFTGKERDEESGLYYHGARYYAPWLARWWSCDPIGIRGGLNLYMYVRGNVLNATDPNGLQDSNISYPPPPTISEPDPKNPRQQIITVAPLVIHGTTPPPDESALAASPDVSLSVSLSAVTPFNLPSPPGPPLTGPGAPGVPVSAPGTPDVGRIRVPGFGPESFRLPFVEPPPPGGIHPIGVGARTAGGTTAVKVGAGASLGAGILAAAAVALILLTPTNRQFPEYAQRRLQQSRAIMSARCRTERLAMSAQAKKDYHHIFPQEFREEFERMGIDDIDQYTIPLNPEVHRIIHSGGWYGGKYYDMYNDEWGMWINEGERTAEEAGEFAADLLNQLGIAGEEYPVVPYPKHMQ
jgi:RHS repeat-associated protein